MANGEHSNVVLFPANEARPSARAREAWLAAYQAGVETLAYQHIVQALNESCHIPGLGGLTAADILPLFVAAFRRQIDNRARALDASD